MTNQITVKRLGPGDAELLSVVADDVFDNEIKPHLAARFLRGDHNVLVVAFNSNLIVGMGSALVYVHPDKDNLAANALYQSLDGWQSQDQVMYELKLFK